MIDAFDKFSRKLRGRLASLTLSHKIQKAYERHQLGFFAEAGDQYCKLLSKHPRNETIAHLVRELKRQAAPPPHAERARWKLIWQVDPSTSWERQWINHLLEGIEYDEITDTKHTLFHSHMIVADALLRAPGKKAVEPKEPYYARAAAQGCRVVLLHLSDELYKDDCTVYPWCDLVVRNYWTFAFDSSPSVIFAPLGYKTGYQSSTPQKATADRKYVWSFMGATNKPSRLRMVEQMRQVGAGFEHFTTGWNAANSMPVEKYREIMDDTILAPCPAGWANLDSFRVYEALEAGCIPIVERRGAFEYFKGLLGDHPLLVVPEWDAVPDVVKSYEVGDRWESHRRKCATWWQAYKSTLRSNITARVRALE